MTQSWIDTIGHWPSANLGCVHTPSYRKLFVSSVHLHWEHWTILLFFQSARCDNHLVNRGYSQRLMHSSDIYWFKRLQRGEQTNLWEEERLINSYWPHHLTLPFLKQLIVSLQKWPAPSSSWYLATRLAFTEMKACHQWEKCRKQCRNCSSGGISDWEIYSCATTFCWEDKQPRGPCFHDHIIQNPCQHFFNTMIYGCSLTFLL